MNANTTQPVTGHSTRVTEPLPDCSVLLLLGMANQLKPEYALEDYSEDESSGLHMRVGLLRHQLTGTRYQITVTQIPEAA